MCFVSTLLWCYHQHKSEQFHFPQKSWAEWFWNVFGKVPTRTKRGSWFPLLQFSLNGSSKKFNFFINPIKFYFLLPSLIIFDVGINWFCCNWKHAVFFLDCSSCSVPITCGKFIPEQFTGFVERSLQSNNFLKQNLFAKCEHSLNPFCWGLLRVLLLKIQRTVCDRVNF